MQRRTALAALAFLAFVSLGLPDGLLGVAWPSISGEFGVPLDALGILVAVSIAGYLTSSFLSGATLRRFPLGTVLWVSTAAAGLELLGLALAPSWPAVVVLVFVGGLSGGAVDAGLNAYGARHFSNRTLNWLHAFWGLGTTLGPLIVTAVLDSGLVWRWSYAVAGTAQLALAVTLLVNRNLWRELDAQGPRAVSARTLDTLRARTVPLGMLTFAVYAGTEISVAHWSFSLLTIGRGVPETAAGLFVTLYWGSLMTGRVLFGFVADRVPLIATVRGCICASLLGALLFWLQPTKGLAVAGLMLTGLGFAPVFATLIRLTPPRVGAEHADSAIGFQIAAAGVGGAALTGLIGLLSRIFGLEAIGAAIFVTTLILLALYENLARR